MLLRGSSPCWRFIPPTPEPGYLPDVEPIQRRGSGTPTCGPFGENNVYTDRFRQTINGHARPSGKFCQPTTTMPALATRLQFISSRRRHSGKRLNFTADILQQVHRPASSLSDIINPFNFNATRALSAWDLKHSLVSPTRTNSTRTSHLPREILDAGLVPFGDHRVSSGFPVTISEEGDNS